MVWQQLKLTVSKAMTENLSDWLTEQGALAITLIDHADQPIYEPQPQQTPLWERVDMISLFDSATDLAYIKLALHETLPAEVFQSLEQQQLAEIDWENAWKINAKAMTFGQKLTIYPSHCEINKKPPHCYLRLDPGLAFGTGSHPTTALCLQWLTQHSDQYQQVIDYGCGSGILSLAALKLGASKVWAVDYDPQALAATQNNAQNNQLLTDNLIIVLPEAMPTITVDLVIANILLNPLLEKVQQFAHYLSSGDHLVLSGILVEQQGQIAHAYQADFTQSTWLEQEGWLLYHAIRK